jgi:hypothetical protein
MGKHPINLGLRFILEMTAIFAVAYWGWSQHEGWLKFVFSIGLPILLVLVWGIFAVPNDPSRSGKTVVKTPGWLRLVLEFVIFGLGARAFYDSGFQLTALFFLGFACLHYLLWIERIKWLLRH